MFQAFSDISIRLGEIIFGVGGGLDLNVQDQYINHIMNETGATVVLRGRGSGNNECLNGEGTFSFL